MRQSVRKTARMANWSLSIAAWVIQDGNYPDFTKGQRAEFAVEFYAPEALTRTDGGARSAVADGDGWYSIDATIVAVTDAAWVVDCGILVYDERPPEGVAPGDGVRGRVLLSVDHYLYFEALARQPEIPALIYTWDLLRIRRETAPYILNEAQTMYVRDERKRNLVDTKATDAWADDDGHAEYVFDCRLLDMPPKRTSNTTT
jgi:hypothetical protein